MTQWVGCGGGCFHLCSTRDRCIGRWAAWRSATFVRSICLVTWVASEGNWGGSGKFPTRKYASVRIICDGDGCRGDGGDRDDRGGVERVDHIEIWPERPGVV